MNWDVFWIVLTQLREQILSILFEKNQSQNVKKITYANMVCDHWLLKTEKYRVRLTIGGDRLDCTFDTASPAASLLETKILVNSVISDAS